MQNCWIKFLPSELNIFLIYKIWICQQSPIMRLFFHPAVLAHLFTLAERNKRCNPIWVNVLFLSSLVKTLISVWMVVWYFPGNFRSSMLVNTSLSNNSSNLVSEENYIQLLELSISSPTKYTFHIHSRQTHFIARYNIYKFQLHFSLLKKVSRKHQSFSSDRRSAEI